MAFTTTVVSLPNIALALQSLNHWSPPVPLTHPNMESAPLRTDWKLKMSAPTVKPISSLPNRYFSNRWVTSRHSVHLYRKSAVWSHQLVVWKRSTLNFYAANTFSKELFKKTRRLSHGNDEHVLTLLLPFPLPHPGMPAAYDLSTVIGSGQPASHNNLIPLGMNLTSQWRLNMWQRLRGRELEGGVAGTHRRLQKK